MKDGIEKATAKHSYVTLDKKSIQLNINIEISQVFDKISTLNEVRAEIWSKLEKIFFFSDGSNIIIPKKDEDRITIEDVLLNNFTLDEMRFKRKNKVKHCNSLKLDVDSEPTGEPENFIKTSKIRITRDKFFHQVKLSKGIQTEEVSYNNLSSKTN